MPPNLSVAVTGASGLIGARLSTLLAESGHTVHPVRRDAAAPGARWNVETGEIQFPQPVDVLVHLAGRSVASRWTARVKREIRDSRVAATEKLCRYLAGQPESTRPRLLLAASAIGIYGSRGDETLTEDSPPAPRGSSFLTDTCLDWEAATRPAEDAGIRVVHARIGVVLARNGGALAALATPTKLGLAGPVGPGTQFIPWISLTDITRLLMHVVQMDQPPPLFNAVSPAPSRQHEFIRTLGKVLHRPTIFPMPSLLVKLAFGQMGTEMLLSSLRVVPTKAPDEFEFAHTALESALRAELSMP
jgi:uncharacterized protein (TIGR01777 family)